MAYDFEFEVAVGETKTFDLSSASFGASINNISYVGDASTYVTCVANTSDNSKLDATGIAQGVAVVNVSAGRLSLSIQITVASAEDESYLNKRGLTHFWENIDDKKQDKMAILSYGRSTWSDFIDVYQKNAVVYCRTSSNSNPATGSQTRMAFMAYVNNATNPTSVEFQYVRSVSSKTASQPVDQVFIYTLTSANGGTWTVTTRDMGPKLAQGTNTTVSYSNGTYTISSTGGGPTVVQTTGQSTTDVMSQKAVTDIIGNVETILQTLNSGNGAQQ